MTVNPIQRFEAAFAESQEAAAARAFWMGRVGLYALLRALGVGPGDRVGICSYTCLGVVEAVTRLRATPVFLDVDRHMNIAPSALERLRTPLRVLILQHTFGVPCELDASLAWANKRSVPIIEDCCHVLDATWDGKRVGSFGVGGLFGFEWGKPFSAGQGGLVTFRDVGLAHEVDRIIAAEAVHPTRREAGSLAAQRHLHRWLVTPRTRRTLRSAYRRAARWRLISGSEPKAAQLVGPAERFLQLMSRSQARAAYRELLGWPLNRAQRVAAAATIHRKLAAEGIAVVEPHPKASPVYLRVPIWARRKPEMLEAAEAAALDIAGWYVSPAHPLQGKVLEELGYDPAACPTSEEAFARVVTLPTRPALEPAQLDAAVQLIRGAA